MTFLGNRVSADAVSGDHVLLESVLLEPAGPAPTAFLGGAGRTRAERRKQRRTEDMAVDETGGMSLRAKGRQGFLVVPQTKRET